MNVDSGKVSAEIQPKKTHETNQQIIERNNLSLVHSWSCSEIQCRQLSCLKMKRILSHVRSCGLKSNVQCSTCRKITALCCFHANKCADDKCPITFCEKIRHQRLAQTI